MEKMSVTKFDDFISIDSIGFVGPFTTSPNGKYTLSWCEADWSNKQEGRYFLLDGENIILEGTMQRPNDGRVSDNGNFIINDLMFGLELNGTFYAFDVRGNTLIKKYFRANLYSNGISPDGKFAVCQTANSDNEDSSTLSFFDLQAGKLVWQKVPDCGWAYNYEFDVDKKLLYLIDNDSNKFSYSFLGVFLDEENLKTVTMKEAGGFELHEMARERLKNISNNIDHQAAKEILSLLRKALKRDLDRYPNEKAKVHRTMGEVFESLGEKSKAINCYEKALKTDPKIGIKRKLAALKSKNI